jgi:hypothetical protein
MFIDDLPWPELGNVSRGATRGNQGQKGVLSPPNQDGRSHIQLRVQPGVLTVLLNKQATEWYRALDAEVNHALKLTKTYWRKARRRQDYDPVADQDHMELHEWLQQLKDKVMSHLELLMQRGDIKGPPYVMPDNVELTFLRKFIERKAAAIPHNPRLRKAFLENNNNNHYNASPPPRSLPPPSESPEPSDDEDDEDDSVLDGASSDDAWDADRRPLSRGEFGTANLPFLPPQQQQRCLFFLLADSSSCTARSISRNYGPGAISTVSYPPPVKSSPRLDSIRSLEEEAESSSA